MIQKLHFLPLLYPLPKHRLLFRRNKLLCSLPLVYPCQHSVYRPPVSTLPIHNDVCNQVSLYLHKKAASCPPPSFCPPLYCFCTGMLLLLPPPVPRRGAAIGDLANIKVPVIARKYKLQGLMLRRRRSHSSTDRRRQMCVFY